jgi:hypothetical protein
MATPINWHASADNGTGAQAGNRVLGKSHASIDRREHLSAQEFFRDYVAHGRPVVVQGALRRCPALVCWTFDRLRQVSGLRRVKLKQGLVEEGVAGLKTLYCELDDYLRQLEAYEARLMRNEAAIADRPPYLHDVPLLQVLPDAADDLDEFPVDYFPAWYRADWLQFAQFFLGPKHSLTPLHFDCLLTHNLFFQIAGRKRFILLDHDQLPRCYRYRWRWCAVDPESPDGARHPLYQQATVQECTVEPGDMLYLPPGMLHHVRSLDCSISFNVDWHTRTSAVRGMAAVTRGMPLKNAYYNALIALGQTAGISARRILPWYRSYLNYVS